MSKREMLKTTIKSAKMLLVFYGNFFKMMREEQPGNQIMFSDEEFQGAIELFFTVLLSKMVEKQDKEKMPFKKRKKMVEYYATEFNDLVEKSTGKRAE